MYNKDKGKNKQLKNNKEEEEEEQRKIQRRKIGKEDEKEVQELVDRLPQIDVPRKRRSNAGTLYHEIPVTVAPAFEDINIERRSQISTNLLPFKKRYLKLQMNIPVDVIQINDEDYQPQN